MEVSPDNAFMEQVIEKMVLSQSIAANRTGKALAEIWPVLRDIMDREGGHEGIICVQHAVAMSLGVIAIVWAEDGYEKEAVLFVADEIKNKMVNATEAFYFSHTKDNQSGGEDEDGETETGRRDGQDLHLSESP